MTTAAPDYVDRVFVSCPDTGTPWKVRIAPDDEQVLRVQECTRFWGELLCDAPCEQEAAKAAVEGALKRPPVYCGHPNLAAPRPRET